MELQVTSCRFQVDLHRDRGRYRLSESIPIPILMGGWTNYRGLNGPTPWSPPGRGDGVAGFPSLESAGGMDADSAPQLFLWHRAAGCV